MRYTEYQGMLYVPDEAFKKLHSTKGYDNFVDSGMEVRYRWLFPYEKDACWWAEINTIKPDNMRNKILDELKGFVQQGWTKVEPPNKENKE